MYSGVLTHLPALLLVRGMEFRAVRCCLKARLLDQSAGSSAKSCIPPQIVVRDRLDALFPPSNHSSDLCLSSQYIAYMRQQHHAMAPKTKQRAISRMRSLKQT